MTRKKRSVWAFLVDSGLLPVLASLVADLTPGILAKIIPPPSVDRPARPLFGALILVAYAAFIFLTVLLVKVAIRWTPY